MPEGTEERSFDAVKGRLDEIAEEVAREGLSLDDALALYEEAVQLGLAACDLSEADLGLAVADKVEQADAPFEEGSLPDEQPVVGNGPVADDLAVRGFDPDADAPADGGSDIG